MPSNILRVSVIAARCPKGHAAGLFIVQQLNGGVCDAHTPAVGRCLGQDLACITLHCHVEVRGQQRHAWLQLPHMQVCDSHHTLDLRSANGVSLRQLH